MQGVVDAGFLLFHLHFGGGADLDHGHAAGQLGHAFLELLLVVVGGGVLDFLADLLHTGVDVRLLALAADHGGVFLVDVDLLGGTQVFQGHVFQAQADFLGNHGAAAEDRQILQHGFTAVAEAGRFHGGALDDAAHVVDHQGGQRFAFDVLGDDHQRLACLGHVLENRQQLADVGDLLVNQQDVGVFQLHLHLFLVVDEVRAQVTAVELHAFHDFQLVDQGLAFFHGDHAFLADLLHGLGDDLTHGLVGVGGDGAHLLDALGGVTRGGQLLDLFDDGVGGLVDAALEIHRVHAGGNRLQAFVDDGLGQYGGGRGAVTGFVVGLGSDFLDHLRAHVLELVFQLDFLGDGHAVLGDQRRAEGFLQHHVAAFRAQGHFDRVGQGVNTLDHFLTTLVAEQYFFSHYSIPLQYSRHRNPEPVFPVNSQPSMTARISASLMIRSSSPSTFTVLPEY